LILLAVAQLMSAKTYYAALAILVLAAWLFRKRSSFDRLLVHESMRSTIIPILLAILIIVGYGLCGFFILQGDFKFEFGVFSPFAAIAQTLVPFLEDPAALSDHATWFVESLRTIAIVTAVWAVIATIFPWLRKKYRADAAEKNSMAKRLEPYATISVDEAEILEEYEEALGRNSGILDGDMTIPEVELENPQVELTNPEDATKSPEE
ncbi:MAG: hypothetical protein HGA54_05225, partial [Actinobacteria bacterium]|nr:hypothetical protein [Actinomycetota bacterium]